MSSLTVNSCCWCFDLRNGSFVIGYFALVADIILSTLSIMAIAVFEEGKSKLNPEQQRLGAVIMSLSGILLVLLLIMIVFLVMLLAGLHKYKRGLIKVYLIAAGVFFLGDFVLFIVSFIHANSPGMVAFRTGLLVLEAYAFIVVRSYYIKMNEPGKGVSYTTA